MNILVNGVGAENKGAFLMLKAIQQQLATGENGKIILLFRPTKTFDRQMIKKEGLHPLSKVASKSKSLETVFGLIPGSIRRALGLYLRKDVNVFLDSSGFIFGDQWEAKTIKSWFLNDVEFFSRQGTKIIFLPQAFGPFERTDVRAISQKVLDHGDLIFARDSISYGHVTKLDLKRPIIKQFPDFTNLVSPSKDASLQNKDAIAIIANQKLIESGKISRPEYVDFLVKLTSYIQKKGLRVAFVNHAGTKDLELCKEVVGKLNLKTEIINEPDPVRLKQIISSFSGLVSGRFHGVVSALSQNVPCIATSWSHKYQMLMADYGIEHYLLPLKANDSEIEQKLDLLINQDSVTTTVQVLKERSDMLKRQSLSMWDAVNNIIRS